MITRILRLLGIRRRRAGTKLTARYEARRVAQIRRALAMFPDGGVRRHHQEGN